MRCGLALLPWLALALLLPATASRATSVLVFDNGRLNLVDTQIAVDQVIVRDGRGPATTLRVVGEGQFIGDEQEDTWMDLLGRSRLEMLAPDRFSDVILTARDRSHFLCDGCRVASHTSDISTRLHDRASLELLAGSIDGIEAHDRTRITISGGSVASFFEGLNMGGDGVLTVTGGTIWGAQVGARLVEISGGNLRSGSQSDFFVSGDRVRVTGGTFVGRDGGNVGLGGGNVRVVGGVFDMDSLSLGGDDFRVSGGLFDVGHLFLSGTGDLTGGTLASGLALNLATGAVVTIVGSGFNLPDGAVSETSGTLSGFLRDGSPFDVSFLRRDGASLILRTVGGHQPGSGGLAASQSVPEPSATALLAAALVALAIGRRRARPRSASAR
jgi:hypothetical protein